MIMEKGLPVNTDWYKYLPPITSKSSGEPELEESDDEDNLLDIAVPGFLKEDNLEENRGDQSSRGSIQDNFSIGDPAELESNIDFPEQDDDYDVTGSKAYETACKRYRAIYCRRLCKKLKDGKPLLMNNYGMGTPGVKAFVIPLSMNLTCQIVNLKGNILDKEGLDALELVLKENETIRDLNLSGTLPGGYGIEQICEIIKSNNYLSVIDLSANHFTDRDGILLAKALEENRSLVDVNLSVNEFGLISSNSFKILIADNPVIQNLNLSWNQFRLSSVAELAEGLSENNTLNVLNLSWNGVNDEGAQAIGDILEGHSSLEELDLTSNHIGAKGLAHIMLGLETNTIMRRLYLGRNPIPEEAARDALTAITNFPVVVLQEIDFSDIIYSKSFGDHVEDVKCKCEKLQIEWGYSDTYGKQKINKSSVDEAFQFLQAYCKEKSINLAELFAELDEDGSMSVTYDEFREGLENAGIPLTPEQINDLIKYLDADGDGEIDFSELIIGTDVHEKEKQAEAEENEALKQKLVAAFGILDGDDDDKDDDDTQVLPAVTKAAEASESNGASKSLKPILRSGTSFSKQGKIDLI